MDPQFFLALTTRDLLVNFEFKCGGQLTHTQALKSLLYLQTDIGHAYKAAMSKMISLSSNTPAFSFNARNPYFGHYIENKRMYCKKYEFSCFI